MQLGLVGCLSQRPRLQFAAVGEAVVQSGVLRQIGGHLGRPAPRQVVRRSDQHRTEKTQPASLEARVGWLSRTNHGVETFLDHIDQAVGEVEVQFDLGVSAVSVTLRVLRWKRRVPSFSSSRNTLLPTAEADTPGSRPATTKLRVSTTCTNTTKPFKLSIFAS